jgi:hypothetical protein
VQGATVGVRLAASIVHKITYSNAICWYNMMVGWYFFNFIFFILFW